MAEVNDWIDPSAQPEPQKPETAAGSFPSTLAPFATPVSDANADAWGSQAQPAFLRTPEPAPAESGPNDWTAPGQKAVQRSPYAEPDAETWLGRRGQDIRGKQDPRFKDVEAFSPGSNYDAASAMERAKFLGADDAAMADIIKKNLGANFVRLEHDANGYPMVVHRGEDGGEQRSYVNKPGMDWSDIDRGIQGAFPYVLTGGAAGAAAKGAGLLWNMGAQGVVGAATNLASQVGQKAIGSDQQIDPAQIGIMGAISAAVPVVGKLADAGIQRYFPSKEVKQALDVSTTPAASGVKQIERYAKYDDVDFSNVLGKMLPKAPEGSNLAQGQVDDIARMSFGEGMSTADIVAKTGVPAPFVENIAAQEATIQNRFANQNLLEVIKSGELTPGKFGDLRPEVVTTKNLNGVVQDAANTEGRGQNFAQREYLARAQNMKDVMTDDIDKFWGTGARSAAQDALDQRYGTLSARYDKFRKGKTELVKPEDFGPRLTQTKEFTDAMQYATDAEIIRTGNPALGEAVARGNVELTPANVLDMSHYLSMNARSNFGENAAAQMRADQIRGMFQSWIDNSFSKKFKSLNQDYATFKRALEARDKASDLAFSSGSKAADAYKWYLDQKAGVGKAVSGLDEKIAAAQAKAEAAAERVKTAATPRAKSTLSGQVTKAQNEIAALTEQRSAQQAILDEFRMAWGNSLKESLGNMRFSMKPTTMIENMLSRAQQNRVMDILGPEKGKQYIETLFNNQNQARTGNVLYGGPDTAFKIQRAHDRGPIWNVASKLAHGHLGNIADDVRSALSARWKSSAMDKINEMMSEQGVEPVRNVLRSYLAGKQLSEPISAPLLAPTAQGTTQAAGSLGHMPAKQVGAEAGRPLLPAPQTADARDRQKRESDLVAKARSAIDRGAPREKVIERLRKFGVEPIGL